LDGWKADFSNDIAVAKTKDSLHLIESDALLDAYHVLVKSWALPVIFYS